MWKQFSFCGYWKAHFLSGIWRWAFFVQTCFVVVIWFYNCIFLNRGSCAFLWGILGEIRIWVLFLESSEFEGIENVLHANHAVRECWNWLAGSHEFYLFWLSFYYTNALAALALFSFVVFYFIFLIWSNHGHRWSTFYPVWSPFFSMILKWRRQKKKKNPLYIYSTGNLCSAWNLISGYFQNFGCGCNAVVYNAIVHVDKFFLRLSCFCRGYGRADVF